MVVDRCDLPDGFDVTDYELFQGIPAKMFTGHDVIDLGGRKLKRCIHPDTYRDIYVFVKKIRAVFIPGIWFIRIYSLKSEFVCGKHFNS